ncbi:hypothetical protein CHELA1G11_21834 [Hyphomicrobiales bacterium]|nr:hypothetical protein CHELA1G11_21834 [Hyphomicrobiales bacterium]
MQAHSREGFCHRRAVAGVEREGRYAGGHALPLDGSRKVEDNGSSLTIDKSLDKRAANAATPPGYDDPSPRPSPVHSIAPR